MLAKPRTFPKYAPHDFGAYLKVCGKRFHHIAPIAATRHRTVIWASGALLLVPVLLPNRVQAVARIYCKDAEVMSKVHDKLRSGQLFGVKLGFQIDRFLWSLIPQV